MTGKDNESEDREPRYAHLLQPNRDLAANWAVDVARELENYLAELSLSSIPQEGYDSLNFAEAALLIQGSIQVYSRKVEYLYVLVLQALDFIAEKKQAQQQSTSIQDNGKDTDIIEDEEEDFLNLDDVPEEANIDIIDEENGPCSFNPAIKPPACLIVVEGDNIDLSGDAGELASYQISTSSLHRDFLLLDPCDAVWVDEYWKASERKQRSGTPVHPSSSARHRTPRSGAMPSLKPAKTQDADVCGTSQRNNSVPRTFGLDDMDPPDEVEDWHGDTGGAATPGEACTGIKSNGKGRKDCSGSMLHMETDTGGAGTSNQEPGCNDQADEDTDPWAPLNPHEPGTLPVIPYRLGRTTRKRRVKKPADPFLKVAGNRLTSSESTKVWQTLECLEREAWHSRRLDESPPPYEKLRSSFLVKAAPLFDADLSTDGSGEGLDSEESDSDAADRLPDVYQPDFVDNYSSQDPSQQNGQDTGHYDLDVPETGKPEESSLEDLCRSHLDNILKSHAESAVRRELATRVTTWKQKIERNLAEQEAHPPFDIHAYGERVLEKLSLPNDESDTQNGHRSFTEIVAGLEKHEVARTFASLLQLVNNNNVALETGSPKRWPICFTAENNFAVRLLSCRKRHEEMLHYQVPSRSAKNSGRRSLQEVQEELSQPSSRENEGEEVMGFFTFGGQVASQGFSSPGKVMATSGGKPMYSPMACKNNSGGKRMPIGPGRFEVDSELGEANAKSSGLRSTPEGKRRRRPSQKPVRVWLAV